MNTKSLHFDKTIQNWDEALALGNGDIGCLIWNSSDKLRFSIDKNGIWDCSNPPEEQKNFTYADLIYLVKNRKKRIIRKKYDECYSKTTPTKLPTGKIIVNLGVRENIISDLDFINAEGCVTTEHINVRSFVHACNNYGLIEIDNQDISYHIENPEFGKPQKSIFKRSSHGITQSLKNLHYPKARFVKETIGNIIYQYFVQPTNDCFYGIVSGMIQKNNKTLIAYTVCKSKNDDFVNLGKGTIKEALLKGYDAAFEEHKKWWSEYWSKSSITLPDKELEKQWYLNTYLLGAGSRKNHFPMPLQGVWTADNGSLPPWKGDYHHDLNTQMTYTSYLKANHLEQGESFIDYLLNMSDAGRHFAQQFYGVKGLCLPSVMDIEGHALCGWPQYSLAPTNQLWLCQIMSRYYFFTKDKGYLPKIYAYNSEVGEFLMNILEEKNGVYKLPLSSSPEINDNKLSAWLTPNTNYDLALMQVFMDDMITLSHEMGKEKNAALWEKRRSKLEPLAVNDGHVLMLSKDKSLTTSHRHHAHCMSIYPLHTLEYSTEGNKQIIDATIRNLEKLGISQWVGYSVAWMAELYITQGNGNKACQQLHDFFKYNCTKNGFHINGDYLKKTEFCMKYRAFTLEGNFLAMDVIQDMLLYSEHDNIKLFPAIPKEWENVSFHHFRGYNGTIISAEMKNGKISSVKIKATSNCKLNILNDLSYLKMTASLNNTKEMFLKSGDTVIFTE